MAVSKSKKAAVLQSLKDNVVAQKSLVLLSSNGVEESLDATKNYDFRKKARDNGVVLQVVKNTLLGLVFSEVKDFPKLVGQTYLAFLENGEKSDEVAVPKAVVDMVKKDFDKNIGILGAVVNGEFYGKDKTIQLSKTPTFKDSMSSLAGLLQQIGGGKLASLVKEIPAQVCRGVSAYTKNLS